MVTKKGEVPESLKQFTFDKRPDFINKKGRTKGQLSRLLVERLDGSREVVLKGCELLDEAGKPTGKKVDVLIKIATKEQIVNVMLNKAANGSERMIELIFDRVEGKAPQTIDQNLVIEDNTGIDWDKVPEGILEQIVASQEQSEEDVTGS